MTGLELMTTPARIPHLSDKRTKTQSLDSFETGELFLALLLYFFRESIMTTYDSKSRKAL